MLSFHFAFSTENPSIALEYLHYGDLKSFLQVILLSNLSNPDYVGVTLNSATNPRGTYKMRMYSPSDHYRDRRVKSHQSQ